MGVMITYYSFSCRVLILISCRCLLSRNELLVQLLDLKTYSLILLLSRIVFFDFLLSRTVFPNRFFFCEY